MKGISKVRRSSRTGQFTSTRPYRQQECWVVSVGPVSWAMRWVRKPSAMVIASMSCPEATRQAAFLNAEAKAGRELPYHGGQLFKAFSPKEALRIFNLYV